MSFRKKNIRDLSLFRWFDQLINKDFSKISPKFLKKITLLIGIFLLLILFFIIFEVYIPANPDSHETIIYTVQKGWGDDEIAKDLQKLGIIKSSFFLNFTLWRLYSIQRCKRANINCLPRCLFTRLPKKWRGEMY